jgi:hypothetical protein
MFCSMYLLLSIEYLNMNLCTAVCVLNTVFHCGRGLFLSVVRWERRIVVLVNCFMCMLVLALGIAYGQVVLLRTVLNFVA